jgi:nucleoside-diphosphate-sugar epimerase
LCAAARQKGINKIFFTSTLAVYRFAPLGTDETSKIIPFSEYGQSKHEGELVFKEWQQENPSGLTLVIVRLTVAFGEQNRGNV